MHRDTGFVGLRPGGGRRAAWLVPVAVLLLVAVPVAVWGLVGDLSTYHGAEGDSLGPDRMYPPLDVSPQAARRWVTAAALAAPAAALALLWAVVTSRLDGRWLFVLLPLAAAGALAGFGHRVVTAGVIGANIGGGMVMLVLLPVACLLVAGALTTAAVLLLRGLPSRRSRPLRGP
ncbi:hypothetical protein GCM10010124_34610 [Pilimelia terevasa]|uniref:Uncharacterized protein n=1 Tax=Pilimelia terevasa TaxID=53372 RepID=A0A8J3BUH8_9ACTN|nr:hypothetical protein [Pilimelia terevasa]GGK38865.1 hypothetical protein GCM10010124_34610 [Pilimelia terevasa]